MSVNKVILVGNVGKDPEVRYLEKDVAVANFTLATTDRAITLQNGTQVPERTEWHNIVAWRGLATIAEKYIKKGTQIYVEGKLQTRTYEKDGIKRFFTEIYAENIMLLGKKPETGENQTTAVAAPAPDMQAPPVGEDDLPF
ncbi:MAG TPA: single-stranded DNA-binding protein [Paludibacter sp.]|nr:single-stranded DNA-binding protein [Paludibacter sp.]